MYTLKELENTNTLAKASAWEIFGNKEMAVMYSKSLLNQTSLHYEDAILGTCKLAEYVRMMIPSKLTL